MRKMYSEEQLKSKAVEGINDGLEVGGLVNAVAIMDAPASTTLTDAQIDKITNGVFINGTFLALLNPVFYPALLESNVFRGIVITGTGIYCYFINATTKIITLQPGTNKTISLNSIYSINTKVVPAFPTADGKTYSVKFVNGVLTCVEDVD